MQWRVRCSDACSGMCPARRSWFRPASNQRLIDSAGLPGPVSRVLWESCRPNGWRIQASEAEGWIGDQAGQPVRAGRLPQGLRTT